MRARYPEVLDLRTRTSLDELNGWTKGNMMEYLGLEFTEVGEDYLVARLPVHARTKQTFGILHGGASVVLAESVGSIGANMCLDRAHFAAYGLEINANHLRPSTEGYVYGTGRPLHLGASTQLWEVRVTNEAGKLTAICRHTLAIRPKKS